MLQTRGEYQVKPPVPFVPGSEVAGTVRSAPEGSGLAPGDRVAAFPMLGGFAEVAVSPEFLTFPLPDELDDRQGAALILNYHTAWFSLVVRGRLTAGETVLVHGAAGGVGTASIQVAKGLGARTIAVVSSDEKERVAREAGADEVVRSDGEWRDEAKELSGRRRRPRARPGRRRPLHRLPALARRGRPARRRRLHRRLDPRGEGQPPAAQQHRGDRRRLGRLRDRASPTSTARSAPSSAKLIASGDVRPLVGASFPFSAEGAAEALKLIDGRGATGKVVLDVG